MDNIYGQDINFYKIYILPRYRFPEFSKNLRFPLLLVQRYNKNEIKKIFYCISVVNQYLYLQFFVTEYNINIFKHLLKGKIS